MSMRESVGRTWPSIYGDRRVVGEALVGGQLRLQVHTQGSPDHYLVLLPPGELEREIEIDASRLRSVARAQEKEALEHAAQHGLEEQIDGFLSTFSTSVQANRAKASLTKQRLFSRQPTNIVDLVIRGVERGQRVVRGSKGERRFTSRSAVEYDGYYDEKQMTKIGMDFAEYMTSLPVSDRPQNPAHLKAMATRLAQGDHA